MATGTDRTKIYTPGGSEARTTATGPGGTRVWESTATGTSAETPTTDRNGWDWGPEVGEPHGAPTVDSDPVVESVVGETGYLVIGLLTGVIAIFLLPPIFAAIAIFAGYKLRRWNRGRGTLVMAWGVVAGLIGVVFGFLVFLAFL
jgi:hypothetical protein